MTNTNMAAISPDDATKAVADQSNNAAVTAAELNSQTVIDAKTLKPNGCTKDASIDVSFVDEFIDDDAFANQLRSPHSSPQPSQQSSQSSQPSDEESSQQALAPRQPVVFESDFGPEAIEDSIRECAVTVDGNVVKIGNAHVVTTSNDHKYLLETIDTTIPSSVHPCQSFADDSFIATILNNDSAEYRASLRKFGITEEHFKYMILKSCYNGDDTDFDTIMDLVTKLITFDIDDYDQLSRDEQQFINDKLITIDANGININWDLVCDSVIHYCRKTGTLNVISYTYNMYCMIITGMVTKYANDIRINVSINRLIPNDAEYLMNIKNALMRSQASS